jgi:nucleoside-diphosphate-sugar epimerase
VNCVIFGGNGFIGQHFARHILENQLFSRVFLVDINPLEPRFDLSKYLDNGSLQLVAGDVRQKLDLKFDAGVGLICNFAAVHREPGHHLHEYYETNLPGASNVCDWAASIGCHKIIFTRSIAPYGPTEETKSEVDIPTPISGYGGSKLAAEKIHEIWQSKDTSNRTLVIVRPGVVFGAGERGNVSRLIKAVLHRYFFYMGNKETRKAGVYIKELCNAMWWVMSESKSPVTLFNMSMNPGPTMEDYVKVICEVSEIKRKIYNIPFWLLYPASMLLDPIARALRINQPISPVRLKKLIKSNNIVPHKLSEMGYKYKYTFTQSMSDWRDEAPEEWR